MIQNMLIVFYHPDIKACPTDKHILKEKTVLHVEQGMVQVIAKRAS